MEHPTPAERRAAGKQARTRRPRSEPAQWAPAPDRPDPVEVLVDQARNRLPELLPIRYGRMAASPFAFYRGAAAVMAADLGAGPTTGLEVQLCGDAHLANFGGFAAPDRQLVFDLNDFDETHPGPFEWDVLRLAASVELAGRSLGLPHHERGTAVREAASAYRLAMATFAQQTDLDVWQQRLDSDGVVRLVGKQFGAEVLDQFRRGAEKARSKNRFKALDRLTHVVDDDRRFVSDPPLLVPIHELLDTPDTDELAGMLRGLLVSYRDTVKRPYGRLVDGYELVDIARKVVGVGSVGTRSWVILLVGRNEDDPLFLQVKEAGDSVLEPYSGVSPFDNHGERVVMGQSLLQAATDPFLGWDRVKGPDGVARDFYLRQLWDWKASVDLTAMTPAALTAYTRICAWTLARAHARTGDRVAIAGYLGSGDTFDRALADFAVTYADLTERDHAALRAAIDAGTIVADHDH